MSANSASSIVRFGRFEVNFQSGELRHAGQKVKLQEQPFQVLATLLERLPETNCGAGSGLRIPSLTSITA